MKQLQSRHIRRNHLSAAFDRLSEKDQAYLETLTAQLAELHETSPETHLITGTKAEIIVQQNKEQKN
jgi:hypothetical protein